MDNSSLVKGSDASPTGSISSEMVLDMTKCYPGLDVGLEVEYGHKHKRKRNSLENDDSMYTDPKGTLINSSPLEVHAVQDHQVGLRSRTGLEMILEETEVIRSQNTDNSGDCLAANFTNKLDDHSHVDGNSLKLKEMEATKKKRRIKKKKKKLITNSSSLNGGASTSILDVQESSAKDSPLELSGQAPKPAYTEENTGNAVYGPRSSIDLNMTTEEAEIIKSQKMDCGSGQCLAANLTMKPEDLGQVDTNSSEAKKMEARRRKRRIRKERKKSSRNAGSLKDGPSPSKLNMQGSSMKDSLVQLSGQAPAPAYAETMTVEVVSHPCPITKMKAAPEEAEVSQKMDQSSGLCLAASVTKNLDDHAQVDSNSLEAIRMKALDSEGQIVSYQRENGKLSRNSGSLSNGASSSKLDTGASPGKNSPLELSPQAPALAYVEETTRVALPVPDMQLLIGEPVSCDQEKETKDETLVKSFDGIVNNPVLLDISGKCVQDSNKDKQDVENGLLSLGPKSRNSMTILSELSETTGDVTQPFISNDTPRPALLEIHPGKLRKKLLVLDVNGILTDIVVCSSERYTPDTFISGKSVFKRPFCDDFLRFCFEKFHVGVWSSRTRRNVGIAVDFLMGEFKSKLLFCWDQTHCTHTGFNTVENRDKPMLLKELKKLWEKHEPGLPWERGDYDGSNTLLLDDSPYKALRNPPYTAVFPYPYCYKDKKDNSLGPGGDLRIYLERLASADNVQKYVEANPFGQRAITKTNLSWNFYRKIIEGGAAYQSATNDVALQ